MTTSLSNVPVVLSRGDRNVFAALWLVLAGGLMASQPASAQMRALVIKGATVHVGDGQVIERGTVVLQGGKVAAVGRRVDTPFLARTIDARGKYVTPGLIDVFSTLTLAEGTGGGRATAKAADGFDRYADDDLRAALRAGVTAIYLPARSPSRLGGLGAVVRLLPHGPFEEIVLDDEAALCSSLALPESAGPLARVQATEELRRRFRAARDYREAREEYEEDLKEYEEKLAKKAGKDAEQADKSPDEKAGAKKRDRQEPPKKKEKKADQKDKKKKDELKKPKEPTKDRELEVLLRVLDGELRWRVEAHYPAGILNVLDVAEEFNVALVVDGATGAHLVADRLAELEVPVVLSTPPPALDYDPGWRRYTRPDAAAVLREAGVDVYFGSGVRPAPDAAPQLALLAARAVGYGFDADDALEALTYGAARLLGVADDIGRLKRGLRADVVIWSNHPLAPGATVERVFVSGREVYRADRQQDKEDAE